MLGSLVATDLDTWKSSLLANLMLPDGAERQPEDWTIFFLNQTPFNTIAPVLALEEPENGDSSHGHDDEDRPELLYVLNLVRTKLDKTVRRYEVSLFGMHTSTLPTLWGDFHSPIEGQ